MIKSIIKSFMVTVGIAALLLPLLPGAAPAAAAADDCQSEIAQARKPRPSGAYGQDGTYTKFDYSNMPDPKETIFVCVNNQFLVTDVQVQVENGFSLIPMRALLEALQADVAWDGDTRTVTAKLHDQTIRLQVDNANATVNGRTVPLDVPARMKDGRVLVPTRFVSEQLGSAVVWQPGDKAIMVYKPVPSEVTVQAIQTETSRTDDYQYGNYFSIAHRYFLNTMNGIVLIEDIGDQGLRVQEFTSAFEKTGERTVPKRLPQFGGVHYGEDGYFYVVTGQSNMEEDKDKAVYSIVKYDGSWNEAGRIDIADVYVSEPFDAGNLTMDSHGGKLAVYSTRQRYLTPDDGKRHQSNITFLVDMKQMTILYKGGQWPLNHVSHSFAAYVRFDGDRIVYADHGDAYPRSIVVQTEENGRIASELDILKFPGAIGDNYTGAHLGGLEVAADNYLVAGSSVSLTEQYGTNKTNNVYLGVIPKQAKDGKDVKVLWLTHHAAASGINISETHLVKINDDKFVLLWNEKQGKPSNLFYAVIDGSGKLQRQPAQLRDVPSPGHIAPLVSGSDVIWYQNTSWSTNDPDMTMIYKLHID
ncbi:copper amine oxidase N-terminal domain-containing protein [Paenibacillus chartarius]|uniref:Copper amine oxidase N-terminal domain-containing protein n=1 Tax=Paenibacillus chartarius TaxID=747481 RepID=A0ABV6DSB0_9BACL